MSRDWRNLVFPVTLWTTLLLLFGPLVILPFFI